MNTHFPSEASKTNNYSILASNWAHRWPAPFCSLNTCKKLNYTKADALLGYHTFTSYFEPSETRLPIDLRWSLLLNFTDMMIGFKSWVLPTCSHHPHIIISEQFSDWPQTQRLSQWVLFRLKSFGWGRNSHKATPHFLKVPETSKHKKNRTTIMYVEKLIPPLHQISQ